MENMETFNCQEKLNGFEFNRFWLGLVYREKVLLQFLRVNDDQRSKEKPLNWSWESFTFVSLHTVIMSI